VKRIGARPLSSAERSKRWRHKNADRLRRQGRQWYQDNRETALAKVKERQRKKRIVLREQLRLTPEERAACQKDPTQVWTIRGTKWIACIEDDCGALCESLGPHLRQCRHLTAEEYKAKPGLSGVARRYSKNASLSSRDLRAKLSKIRTKLGLGKRLQASGKVPGVRTLVASRGKRVLSQQYRLEQSRRLEGRPASGKQTGARPGRQKISDSKIREIVALVLPIAEAAKLAGISQPGFRARAKKLHLDCGTAQIRQQIVRLVSELRKWIVLQPQIPTIEQITQHYNDDLRSDLPSPSRELSPSFITHLEAELREHPEMIAEIAVKGAAMIVVQRFTAAELSTCAYFDSS
jgi:predicted transcriptional regulator